MDLDSFLDGFGRRDWRSVAEGTLRFATVGLGWWTVEHAIPAVDAGELCETTTVVSSSAEKAGDVAESAETIENAITYDAFHEGEAAADYDAVYVATPNAHHLEYVESAADRGKAVLCEKPMEATVERAEELVEAAADVPLMVGYRMHTQPAIRRARELVQAGVLGDPVHAHGTFSQDLLDMNSDPDQWRLDPDLSGYGTSVMDLGIYPINTARFVLEQDPVEVTAVANSYDDAFDEVPDERAAFTMLLADGVHVACTASQNAHVDTRLAITGTEGRLDCSPAFYGEVDLAITRGDASAEITFDGVDEMEEEFDYFADRVLAGEPIEPDGDHGLVDLRTLSAIYESASTGEAVEVGRA